MNPQQFNFLGNNTLQNFQNNTGGVINQASNESVKFPWLTKEQEAEITKKANQANVTESQKNYILNDMYQQQLRRNQIDKFAEEREWMKRQLLRKAVESKDVKTSNNAKETEKKWDVADMIRKYVSATQEIDLNKLNKVSDDQIIADFTADNPDVAYAIDDFTKSQMSSQYFSEMMGFSQFEEQQDEWFFKNLLNSITYGVETWAKWLKWLIDKWLDTVEWNSNESSYSMENLTAFDNYIQHKYWVSGSQLRESDKEVWQQERNLVNDNPEILKQYMTTTSEDVLNFAEWYTDALFTATNPYMALGMKTIWAAEQEMWGGVLTWLAEKMGWVGELINEIPWLSNYRDTLSPEDQQRFDAFVGNVAVWLILWTKNKKNIVKDPKTFLMENLQPNQITKNFVQSVTWMPDKFFWATDSLAGGAKWLMSKTWKWLDNLSERWAKKITWTVSSQDKLYKAQEPRMNVLSEKKNLEKRRANSDRANELILENGYKPTNTSERLDAHQKTLNKLWGEVMDKVNKKEWVVVDQTPMIEALSNYIKEKKKLGVAGIESDIKALEAELKALKKMQAEWNTDIPILENKKQIYNDLIDRKWQEASEVYKGWIKLLTNEIWKIEDAIISEIPWEFSSLKRDVWALLDSYEDVFKADMKNQRKKWLWLTETYSRIEWIGDTLWGIVKLFWWDASGLVKWLWKLALGKSLAKASDVDFLIKQWFEDLANEKLGGNESQASSKTAKYQTAYHGSKADFEWFDSSHMGEWEWNQAHWWGHYIAVDKNTAHRYAEMWWKPSMSYKGKNYHWLWYTAYEKLPIKEQVASKVINAMEDGKTWKEAVDYVKSNGEFDIERYEKMLLDDDYMYSQWFNDKDLIRKRLDKISDELDALVDLRKNDFYVAKNRNLYEVEIPDPVKRNTPTRSNYLEEDYILNEKETNRLADAIDKYVEENKDNFEYVNPNLQWRFNNWEIDRAKLNADTAFHLQRQAAIMRNAWLIKWKNLVMDLQNLLGDKGASKFLESLWYDGIHYYGGRDGEAYVIFKDNAIKINKHDKYQKYWVAWQWEKWISATEWLNIRNFKNWKTVQELANQYWIDTNIVDSISTPEWQRAYWMYWDRLITLSKDLKESTVPHELLHGVFDMVDSKRRTSILEWIQKKLNIDNVQAEEWLADNFSEYYRTGKFWTKWLAKWLVEKVKQFFYQVKSYIDWTYKNEKQIRQLFDDIIDWKIEWEYGVYSDPKFQSVWHGSPADFERFDSTHMGEWEWAQAHGWGHYVAKEKWTAEHYATMRWWEVEFRWKNIDDYISWKEWIYSSVEKAVLSDMKQAMSEWFDTPELAKERLWGNYNAEIRRGEDKIFAKAKLNTLENMDVDDFTNKWSNLYEVEIPDPIKKDTPTGSNYLEEWVRNTDPDFREKFIKPEQVDKFVDLLKNYDEVAWQKLADKMYYRSPVAPTMLWADMYKELSRVLGSDKEASKFLNKIWYDWIHYFWGRDWEAYVIFNDDALEITKHHKY